MSKFRKKPVVIEARLYEHHNPQDGAPYLTWIREGGYEATFDPFTGGLVIKTLEGDMHVSHGDYIIKGVQGEFYPCRGDIFKMTYEPEPESDNDGSV